MNVKHIIISAIAVLATIASAAAIDIGGFFADHPTTFQSVGYGGFQSVSAYSVGYGKAGFVNDYGNVYAGYQTADSYARVGYHRDYGVTQVRVYNDNFRTNVYRGTNGQYAGGVSVGAGSAARYPYYTGGYYYHPSGLPRPYGYDRYGSSWP